MIDFSLRLQLLKRICANLFQPFQGLPDLLRTAFRQAVSVAFNIVVFKTEANPLRTLGLGWLDFSSRTVLFRHTALRRRKLLDEIFIGKNILGMIGRT